MSKPLKINIARPCSENWEQMKTDGKGRFCENCKKTIIDFSALSDQELYRYFSGNTSVTCGRFHNDQLDKNIFPVTNKRPLFKRISGAAAGLLTLLNMPSLASENIKKQVPFTTQPTFEKYQLGGDPPVNIIISGLVRDEHGNKLEKAEIKIGDSLVTVTDKDGKFEFEVKENSKPLIFQVGYTGMIAVVRSYHPAMQSTQYNIVLDAINPAGCHIMGIVMPDTTGMPSIAIDLVANAKTLREETKNSLAELATWMRNYPRINITINAYIGHKKETANATKIQASIKKHLSYMEGIGEERIQAEIYVTKSIKQSRIEIISSYSGEY